MAKLIWYRWWPGAIPQIERVSPSVRGLAHAVMDHLWAHPEEWRDSVEVLKDLMLPFTPEDLEVLTRMFPLLVAFIESERKDHEEHRLAKVEAGRKGGLAKASSAKQSLAELSTPLAEPSPSFHPSILPSVEEDMSPSPAEPATVFPRMDDELRDKIAQQAKQMCHAWPKVNPRGEALPRASQSLTRKALGELVRKGYELDGLCKSAVDYLRDFKDNKRPSLKAPQNYFGPKGPWEDHYAG